ncbi:hypothetical protein SPD48_09650 [Pseudogracilibacillus sp. SE30717A]|uniref:hypothetical protein n=1 Tax=Pseudogracilibacillus sp. SE30717A TaxID=3098293 RepID=UPI00300DCF4B
MGKKRKEIILKNVLMQLTDEAGVASKLKELGIPTLDKEGNFRGIKPILQDIRETDVKK